MSSKILRWVALLLLLLAAVFLGTQIGPEEHFDDSKWIKKEDSLMTIIGHKQRELTSTAAQRDSTRVELGKVRKKVVEVEQRMEDREKIYIRDRGERRNRWFKMSKDSLSKEAKNLYLKYNPDSSLIDDDTVVSEKMTMVFLMEKAEQVPYLEAQLVDNAKQIDLKDTENSYLRHQIVQYQADSSTFRGIIDAEHARYTNAEEKHAQREQQLEKEVKRHKLKATLVTIGGVIITILVIAL